MRILYLTMNPNRASTTVPTEGWFRFLRPKGLEPVLASHEVGDFHYWALEQAIPSYHIPLPAPSKSNPLPFINSLCRLWRLVKRHKIEIIHCNEQNIYPIGKYLGLLSRLPTVVSVHSTMERSFTYWAFRNWRGPDRMFFVSKRNLEACYTAVQGIVPESTWRVLHNGLDLEQYQPDKTLRKRFRSEHGLGSGPLIGVACAIRPGKQVEDLFEAAIRLNTSDLKIAVAGGPVAGGEQYSRMLFERAKAKLGSKLFLLGHLPDLRGFCNSLDLFINTSKEESFGICPLEAMACGCPVIGYPSKAVDEVVLPDGGAIVQQGNLDQLVEACRSWLQDPNKLNQARLKARKQAEKFNIRSISEYLWSEYSAVLDSCRK